MSAAPSFSDRTTDWGLSGVNGARVMTADLDGDDYPDLVIHSLGSERDPLTNGAPSKIRILMNRPAGDGRSFVEATLDSGYGTIRDGSAGLRSAQLAVAGDVDNDGDLDLFSGSFSETKGLLGTPTNPDHSEILINDGSGKFSLGPPLETLSVLDLPISGASFADVDRDGNLDLFVVSWYRAYGMSYMGTQARLLLGNGDGSFRDGTEAAGLITDSAGGYDTGTNSRPAYGTTSCDVDQDGDTDLLVSAYGRQFNQLYLNDGAGHFSDVGAAAGYAGDENLDYSGDQFFLCWCTLHQADDPKCPANPQPLIGCPTPADSGWGAEGTQAWRNNGNTFSTACSDVTGDGVYDLFNAEIRHFWAGDGADKSELLVGDLSSGSIHYSRPTADVTGIVWPHPSLSWNEGGITAVAADLDNDGREDVLIGASDYPDQYAFVFHQKADGSFEEVGESWGIHHPCGVGLAVADFDLDGDLDVVVASGTARDCSAFWKTNEVHLYENDAATKANWLSLKLGAGAGANRRAIGAQVSVRAGNSADAAVIHKQVGGGYGHFGMQHGLSQHVGLGACEAADSVEVRWPDAALTQKVLGKTPAGQLLVVEAD